jgi:hypothetical protein
MKPAIRDYPMLNDKFRVSLNFSAEIIPPPRVPADSYQQPPEVIVIEKKNSDLGDFLSSLKRGNSTRW